MPVLFICLHLWAIGPSFYYSCSFNCCLSINLDCVGSLNLVVSGSVEMGRVTFMFSCFLNFVKKISLSTLMSLCLLIPIGMPFWWWGVLEILLQPLLNFRVPVPEDLARYGNSSSNGSPSSEGRPPLSLWPLFWRFLFKSYLLNSSLFSKPILQLEQLCYHLLCFYMNHLSYSASPF